MHEDATIVDESRNLTYNNNNIINGKSFVIYTFNNICNTQYILCKINLQLESYFIFYKCCFPDILLTTVNNTLLNTNALNVQNNTEDDIRASSNTTFCNMGQYDMMNIQYLVVQILIM